MPYKKTPINRQLNWVLKTKEKKERLGKTEAEIICHDNYIWPCRSQQKGKRKQMKKTVQQEKQQQTAVKNQTKQGKAMENWQKQGNVGILGG